MAATKTSIANSALRKISQLPLTDFDSDESMAGKLARETFDDLRDAVLQDHLWNFAIRRVAIAADADAPLYEWDYAYPFPESPHKALRILEVQNEEPLTGNWVSEGNRILTNFSSPINVRYVSQEEIVADYPPLFREALAARLAAEWCIPLDGPTSLHASMWQLYREKLGSAKTADGQEGMPPKHEPYGWIQSRWYGRGWQKWQGST